MSRLVHVRREVTTRTPLWLFYQWVIFQLLSFSGETAWQDHYGSHQHIKGSEQSCYLSERLKAALSYGCCKWAITAIQNLVGHIQKHDKSWTIGTKKRTKKHKTTGFVYKCTLVKWAQCSSLSVWKRAGLKVVPLMLLLTVLIFKSVSTQHN